MHLPVSPTRRLAAATIALLSLAACDGGEGPVPLPNESIALQVVSREPMPGVAGQWLPEPVRLRVVDQDGKGVEGVSVALTVSSGGGTVSVGSDNTDADGYLRVFWSLGTSGDQRLTASIVSGPSVQVRARLVPAAPAVAPMLGQLADYIPWSIDRLVQGLPSNPAIASYMQARIDVLRTPNLGGDIVDGQRFVLGGVPSRSGATLPVSAVFPVEGMRAEARQTVALAEAALPLLEEFTGRAYPAPYIRVWYGFSVGSAGGGGNLHLEDRTTYQARTQGQLLPYDAITVHEIAHTYMPHEGLNQLLELYGINRVTTGSSNPRAWTHTRGWVPGRATNSDIHALLDIYDLLGPEATATAYRAVLPLNPPYGQPLSDAAKQAFVAAVPQALRAQVAAKLERVAY